MSLANLYRNLPPMNNPTQPPTDKALRFAAYRNSLACERIAANLVACLPRIKCEETRQLVEESACEAWQAADDLQNALGVQETLDRLTGRNAKTIA